MLVSNARMYAAVPGAVDAWRAFFAWLAEASGVGLTVIDHAYPAPLGALWERDDLGCAFMCGYPFMRASRRPRPLAAPVPAAVRYGGRPVYATDFAVRADSAYMTLTDTFGGRLGYTVDSSQSGFNAVRHHLLRYRNPARQRLYRQSIGGLHTPRRVVEALRDGRIDVGPLDSYAFDLMRRHEPALAAEVRIVESTALTPAPFLVAGRECPDETVDRLQSALFGFEDRRLAEALCLIGFAPVSVPDYEVLLERAREAEAAGYAVPV